jgi:replicative DNA helicase
LDVERALLSTALAAPDGVLGLVSRGVTPELFSPTPAGQQVATVYRWCVDFTRHYGQQPSVSTIQRSHPDWHGEFSPDPLDSLADEFLDAARKRYFEAAVVRLAKTTQDRSTWGRLDEVMLDAAREVASMLPSGRVARFSADLDRRIDEYEDEKGRHRPGTPMGIPVIDETTHGLKSGWLATAAGYSGVGKSYLAIHALLSAFESDKQAMLMTLEMSASEVLERLDTMIMRWRYNDLMHRRLTDHQIASWRDVARVYGKARGEIVILDKLGSCTLDRVHAEIDRHKPDVVALDYVQRMRVSYASKRPRYEQLEEITNDLKTIAMDTDTAIIMVSQDGRSSAEEGSTRSNMGGSISVYQAADVYLGLMQDEPMRAINKMRVKMLKFRHGPNAEVDMLWQPETGTFERWVDTQQFVKGPA